MFVGMKLKEEAAEYHARQRYISSSPLPEMKKSPAHFYEKWMRSPEPSAAMIRGTFFHDVLLEQALDRWVPRPLTPAGNLVASNTKQYLEFVAANPNKTPIAPDQYDEALQILDSACKNRKFVDAFDKCHKEASFYAEHKDTGLFLKARADMVADDFSFILDVKSTQDITKFEKQIFEMAYDVRLVHYIETIYALTGHRIPEVYFFAIESKAPFACRVYQLSPADIETARIQWQQWINQISVCIADKHFPSFSDEIVTVTRPKWLSVEEVSFGEIA